MKDLRGQTVQVGDKVSFAMNSYKGYLGLGIVMEVIPEGKHPREVGRVVPSRLRVKVMSSSNGPGPKPGDLVTLGNAFRRAYGPGSRLDTVFVYFQ
jgi:hypothetical protein